MVKLTVLLVCTLLGLALGCSELNTMRKRDACPHWSYDDSEGNGPSSWGSLCSSYATCSSGVQQSPINIVSATEVDIKSPELVPSYYEEHNVNFLNNGHTLVVSSFNDKPNTLTLPDGSVYTLLQFHFHDGSEHQLNGKSYDLEMHLVHQNSNGNLAVLGFFFQEGAANVLLDELIGSISQVGGANNATNVTVIELEKLITSNFDFYAYNGSLTTPPCTENVKWFVSTTVLTATSSQISTVANAMGRNNRPVQALGARTISNFHLNSSGLALSPSLCAAALLALLVSFVLF